jgi:hypothetical protein
MTIAKIAYLSTPGPDRFVLNIQTFGSDDLQQFEITKAHMINILIDGTALALRENYQAQLGPSNRVPVTTSQESADDANRHQRPA